MKKYGINDHEYDDTPGFRDSFDFETWFDSEEERDKQFEALAGPQGLSPKGEFLEQQLSIERGGDGETHTYTKIEKDD